MLPWRRSTGVLWRSTAGGSVVLLADGRASITLTGLDHQLWTLLADPATEQHLVDRLGQQAHNGQSRTLLMVTAALRGLAARGLVRQPAAATSPAG
jgi:hypothetical protein